jgi:hypothetical protein
MISYEVPLIKNSKIIEKEVNVRATGVNYRVLKYDEKYVCDNDEKLGLYRSVIYTDDGKLLCYSPPKSLTMDTFRERKGQEHDVLVTEVVEGAMLSLFWDDRIGGWELASKGSVGGNYWFYRTQYEDKEGYQKTFRDMFLEAFRAIDFSSAMFAELPKGDEKTRFCYNFVLQHPENHIVLKVPHPRVVLVGVYGIEGETATFVSPTDYQEWSVWQVLKGIVDFPERQEDLLSLLQTVPGCMYLNTKTGERACLENPAYVELKELRGNNPNLHYQYLCLLRIGKIGDFLIHFPQYKRLFGRFRQQWDIFVTHTHQAYLSYFIKKEGNPISKRYFPLIHKLHHEVYLPSLSQTKIVMKRPVVFKHLLEFPPSLLFHYLYFVEEV